MNVIVSREDLDKVEEARKALYDLFKETIDKDKSLLIGLTEITRSLWKVSNRKYPAASDRTELVENLSEYILAEIRKRFPDDSLEMQDDLLWDHDIWRGDIFPDAQMVASKKLLAGG